MVLVLYSSEFTHIKNFSNYVMFSQTINFPSTRLKVKDSNFIITHNFW